MPGPWMDGGYGGARARFTDDGHIETDGTTLQTVKLVQPGPGSLPAWHGEKPSPRGIEQWRGLIDKHGAMHQLPPALLAAEINNESGGQQNAVSHDGGMGLLQLTSVGAKGGYPDDQLIRDPEANIHAGAKYLASQLRHYGGNIVKGLAAYNAGGAYHSTTAQNPWNLAMTKDYVGSVLAAYNAAIDAGFSPTPGVYTGGPPVPPEKVLPLFAVVAFAGGAAAAWYVIDQLRKEGSLKRATRTFRRAMRP